MSEQELHFVVDEDSGEHFSAMHLSVPRPGDHIRHRIENHYPKPWTPESKMIEGVVDRVAFVSKVAYVAKKGLPSRHAAVWVYLKNVVRKPLEVRACDANE